jgi:predicted nuclease of predicted toxin-antitoxin system
VRQDQRLAAGAEEAEHLPVVDDLDLHERHQQKGDPPGVALLTRKVSMIAHCA